MSRSAEQTFEYRDVRFAYSANLPELLSTRQISLLISTYQTGHVIVVHALGNQLSVSFNQFEHAMGLAYRTGCVAVCTGKEVWFARNAPDIAAKLAPRGRYDACFLARTMHFTGDIRAHEAAWVGNEIWIVNTLFSCLCSLHQQYSFAPRWRPPFISALAPEDRCHLNGMAVVNGQPKYVTALAETDSAHGWRTVMESTGCILEVPSGEVVARGLAAPHSPRVHDGQLYFLNSGIGRLEVLNLSTGKSDLVAELPGVPRGLAMHSGLAFVGLSKARPSWTGIPLASRREDLKCGMSVVDLNTGKNLAILDFTAGIREIFDVAVLPGIAAPFFSGPLADLDARQPMWTIPPEWSGTRLIT